MRALQAKSFGLRPVASLLATLQEQFQDQVEATAILEALE